MKEKMSELELNVEAKRVELQDKFKCNVHSFIIKVGEKDNAVAYIREPVRLTKLRVMDLVTGSGGVATASDLLISSCLIEEESDKRIATDDKIYMTLIVNCMDLIQYYSNVQKKS